MYNKILFPILGFSLWLDLTGGNENETSSYWECINSGTQVLLKHPPPSEFLIQIRILYLDPDQVYRGLKHGLAPPCIKHVADPMNSLCVIHVDIAKRNPKTFSVSWSYLRRINLMGRPNLFMKISPPPVQLIVFDLCIQTNKRRDKHNCNTLAPLHQISKGTNTKRTKEKPGISLGLIRDSNTV